MALYKTRQPALVEAAQFDGSIESAREINKMVTRGSCSIEFDPGGHEGAISVHNGHGRTVIEPGQYVVDVRPGELQVLAPLRFAAIYEPAE